MTWLLRFRLISGWFGALASVGFLAVVGFLHGYQPDRFAAFTVMPVWVWGGCGIIASIATRKVLQARWMWGVVGAWCVLIMAFADEARTLRNFRNEVPVPGRAKSFDGKSVIRVITANCDLQIIPELAAWKPDVVLLQDVWPFQAHRIAREIYGKDVRIHFHETNAIITHWEITDALAVAGQRAQVAAIERPCGRSFVCVNVHLLSAATDLSFWRRKTWTEHRVNRAVRMDELERIMSRMDSALESEGFPVLFGGDFNAPPDDPVYRMFEPRFVDAHRAAGTRWGNTYHRRFPILRIDRIHATPHFTPVRCGTHIARASDHRFVVADFVLADGE
jgi:endonuclease/exonuclease/phosphatase (EEP) superfamily protein YafD